MANDPYAGRKGRVFAAVGAGIAAFIGAYRFATTPPPEGTPSAVMPVLLVVIGVAFLAIGGLMAYKLSKENAWK